MCVGGLLLGLVVLTEDVMLTCLRCDREAFLYRGLCSLCDPAGHAHFEADRSYWKGLFDTYKTETGLEPLDDWCAWEIWAEKKGVQP